MSYLELRRYGAAKAWAASDVVTEECGRGGMEITSVIHASDWERKGLRSACTVKEAGAHAEGLWMSCRCKEDAVKDDPPAQPGPHGSREACPRSEHSASPALSTSTRRSGQALLQSPSQRTGVRDSTPIETPQICRKGLLSN